VAVNKKLIVVGAIFALFVILVAVGYFVLIGAKEKALAPYGEELIQLTDADRAAAIVTVRECLKSGRVSSSKLPKVFTAPYDKDAFITLFAPDTIRMTAGGRRKTVAESLENVCVQLREHPNFATRYAKKLDKTIIAVQIMNEVKTLKTREPKEIARLVEPGIHGLIIDYEGKHAFQIAEEVIYAGWGMKGFGDRDRVMGPEMVQLQMKKLCEAGSLRGDVWKNKEKSKLYYFTEHSFVEMAPGGKVMVTYRGHELFPKEITRSQLLERAWLAARHLAMFTDEKGRLGYHYRPTEDKFSSGYNIVRHAGAVWGLFTAYRATGDKELLEAGRRALAYLEPYIKVTDENPNVAVLKESREAYLGSNALTVLSLLEMPQELLTPEWKEKREKLANSVIAYQAPDGLFYASWTQVQRGGPVPMPQPRYYPGEAFLSLVTMYEVDGQKKWLEAAKKCAETQMGEWDKKPKQQPDAWVVQAMSKLFNHTKDPRLVEYVFKMVEWHFEHQWGMPEKGRKMPYEDYFGGADNSTPPRSTPTSARNEANIAAWHLAKSVGNAEMLKKLGDSVLAGYWDNFVDQFMPETIYFLPKPEKALGGIRGSLISDDIRIDYNQHFLSSAIHGLELAEERYGIGEFSPLAKGKILDVKKLGITPEEAEKQLSSGSSMPLAPEKKVYSKQKQPVEEEGQAEGDE